LILKANVVKPDLTSDEIQLEQTSDGRYEADFTVGSIGAYSINITEWENNKVKLSQVYNVVVPYSPEYRDIEVNNSLLKEVAMISGGIYTPEPKEVASRVPANECKITSIWQILIVFSIPRFFDEVIIRRVVISREQVLALKERLHIKKRIVKPSSNETITRLKSSKTRAYRFQKASIEVIRERPSQLATENISNATLTTRLLSAKRRAMQNKG
jgi:hypothetical protein